MKLAWCSLQLLKIYGKMFKKLYSVPSISGKYKGMNCRWSILVPCLNRFLIRYEIFIVKKLQRSIEIDTNSICRYYIRSVMDRHSPGY